MTPWKDSLQKFRDLNVELSENTKTNTSNLKFNLHSVPVSAIAHQYYCEKQVELKQIYGMKETPEARIGTEAHEKLLEDTIQISEEEVWSKIGSGFPIIYREMSLISKYQDVFIRGKADVVCFDEGSPQLLLEHKYTRSRYPWINYHVQARIYCLLLHMMGFNTDRLKYALILAPYECRENDELRKLPNMIPTESNQDRFNIQIDNMTVSGFITKFNLNKARDELNWSLGFWKEERDIIPNGTKGKCARCDFNKKCPFSLI